MEIHEMKIKESDFKDLLENRRNFDIEPNDNFKVGEYLHYFLEEGDDEIKSKARDLFFKIVYITENKALGTDMCVLQLKKVSFVEKEVK